MRTLLLAMVCELVDQPEDAQVIYTLSDGDGVCALTVKTAAGEVGKVIGKKGRNAEAMRTLLESVAAKFRLRVVLDIADSKASRRRERAAG
jgi:predicted RNA-binding protein YlqC (UPF0109 family)